MNSMERPRIMVLVASYSDGFGGHYHSAKTICHALKDKFEFVLVNVGLLTSPTLEKSGFAFNFIRMGWADVRNAASELAHLIIEMQPAAIHAYDYRSLLLLQCVAPSVPYFYTKCGGGLQRGRFPRLPSIICFHDEDRVYFEGLGLGNVVSLIPNRVVAPSIDRLRVSKLQERVGDESICIVRIGRIWEGYRPVIESGFELVRELQNRGIKCTYLVIGNAQDSAVLEDLRSQAPDCTVFITEKEYTYNAAELLGVADVVIGTGRSFMEAASLGKFTLCYTKGRSLPVPVDKGNFQQALSFNFSPRFKIDDVEYACRLEILFSRISVFCQSRTIDHELLDLARTYFLVGGARDQYFEIYRSVIRDCRSAARPIARPWIRLIVDCARRDSTRWSAEWMLAWVGKGLFFLIWKLFKY